MEWVEHSPEVVAAGLRAARDVWHKYPNVMELDDLEQEARLYMATHPSAMSQQGENVVYVRDHVGSRLERMVVRELRRQQGLEPLSVIGEEEGSW